MLFLWQLLKLYAYITDYRHPTARWVMFGRTFLYCAPSPMSSSSAWIALP